MCVYMHARFQVTSYCEQSDKSSRSSFEVGKKKVTFLLPKKKKVSPI